MDPVALFVSVPVASFRAPLAREYFETLPCPPPSTVYGMLLSLVGEADRTIHQGAELAIAMLSRPSISVVLRTLWRIKDQNTGLGLGENKRPDYQELLTDIRLAVWVRPGAGEPPDSPLASLVGDVVLRKRSPARYGGLALGESTHLVDEIRLLRDDGLDHARLLSPDPQGDLALPIWPDHVGSAGTNWGQYRLIDRDLRTGPSDDEWTVIAPL